MLIGYARISKADGSQSLDLQRDALREAGVSDDAIYEDQASGQQRDTKVSELCLELGVTKARIYRYVAPDGSLRNRGRQVLAR